MWKKILEFFGFDSDDDEVEDHENLGMEESQQSQPEAQVQTKRPQQIVDLRQRQQFRVVVLQPRSFDDVPTMVEHIKIGRPVILNLEGCDSKCRQRVLDFMSGATYGSGGKMQKISECIFLSAPSNITVDTVSGEFYDDEDITNRPSPKKGN